MRIVKILILLASVNLMVFGLSGCSSSDKEEGAVRQSTKRERNYMKEGKNLYEKQRYAEAEVNFKKALGENPENGRAQFNLASAYLKQRGEDLANKGDSLIQQADKILTGTAGNTVDVELAENSFYDRGNISYKAEDYAAAIEMYKNALRRNPENNQARQNLRLAQLKKQEQDQNQDKNQDKNQDQNKDQNQDKQDQQQQDQQNQDQEQNQDQKDQNQDKQNQDQQQQQNQDKQQQQQQQGGLSQQSANQILKAMDDKESATRQKVELMKQGQEKQANRRQSGKPW